MQNYKNILILRFSSLGDIVLTSSVVKKLSDEDNYENLYYLTKGKYSGLLTHFPANLNTISYSSDGDHPLKFIKLIKSLNNLELDLVIDLHNSLRSNILLPFIKSNQKIKVDKRRKARKEYVKSKLPPSPPLSFNKQFQKVLHEIGFNEEQTFPKLNTRKEKKENLVGIHPFSKWESKEWCLKKYIRLAKIFKNNGYKVRLFEDKSHSIPTQNTNLQKLNNLSISELAEKIAECNYFISNDSGPVHIAAATGANVVAIYGSTDPRIGFKPVGRGDIEIVQSKLDCQPCTLHGKDQCRKFGNFKCLEQITVDDVWQAFHRLER